MTKPIQIDIQTYPRFSLRRWAMVISLYVGMFGAGLLADSAAMQWFAFVVLLLIGLAYGIQENAKNERLTIEQAKARLAEIEAEEKT